MVTSDAATTRRPCPTSPGRCRPSSTCRVMDLAVEAEPLAGRVTLYWTAPGDDGMAGRVGTYDIRYATGEIVDAAAFAAATPVLQRPTIRDGGTPMNLRVSGLPNEVQLYFALRAVDDADNASAISNGATATTAEVAPARISNLRFLSNNKDSITVTWTAPGDDGNQGQASNYDLRYSQTPITDSTSTWPPHTPSVPEASWRNRDGHHHRSVINDNLFHRHQNPG